MPLLTLKPHHLRKISRITQLLCIGIIAINLSIFNWPALSPAQEVKLEEKNQPAEVAPKSDVNVEEPEDTDVTKALDDLLQAMKLGDFIYQTDERPDPFLPFISDKVNQPEDADSENGERLSGMRQFEPGQLVLVAIIFSESNPMAMVEDSSHKGYVIRRGTKIGKTGVVTDILPNGVIIKQLSYSMDQVKKYSTIEMFLRKEGEK